MLIKDMLSLSLLKKVLDETHSDGKNLTLSLDGLCLRQECCFETTHVKFYKYYSMPFDVCNLDDCKFTLKETDLLILLKSIVKNAEEQGSYENIEVLASNILIKI